MANNILFNDFPAELAELRSEYQVAIDRVFDSGWFILGKEVEAFESEFARYLGVNHAIGVANGLEAIQIALMGLGIKEGDEVITTPLSAVATTLAILAVGATPLFVDLREDGQINENLIESTITPKTKAILPVHLYGNSCNIEKIKEIADQHKLVLIEDAAQAHGSLSGSQKLGTIGSIGCFSFYPTKNVGAFGDAGAIVTNDEKLAITFRQLRDYGQESKYKHVRIGLNSRLDEIHAAILRVKLKHLDKQNAIRIQNAKAYQDIFQKSGIEYIAPQDNTTPNYHQFVIKVTKRDELQAHLKSLGIPTLVHYPILIPRQPMFSDQYSVLNLPTADKLVTQILSLPCGPYLTQDQASFIAKSIVDFFAQR
ncbi:MAG: pyridoxal phosphate-dependent protein [Microgenomates group bacterium GW2011_GWF1_46_12]|nr:MAG: pyridoxal phosphate-dependent protein [Microgenomates group bacterium GW2011_GWF1_46_12]